MKMAFSTGLFSLFAGELLDAVTLIRALPDEDSCSIADGWMRGIVSWHPKVISLEQRQARADGGR
jgi:hypothetical protein